MSKFRLMDTAGFGDILVEGTRSRVENFFHGLMASSPKVAAECAVFVLNEETGRWSRASMTTADLPGSAEATFATEILFWSDFEIESAMKLPWADPSVLWKRTMLAREAARRGLQLTRKEA